jgi:hypothetical protein
MKHIIDQQDLYVQTNKQRIVHNLNSIDDEINIETNDDVDMEGEGTKIREMFMKHIDNKGNILLHSMEHTNNSDVYRLLFDEANTEQVDTLLVMLMRDALECRITQKANLFFTSLL